MFAKLVSYAHVCDDMRCHLNEEASLKKSKKPLAAAAAKRSPDASASSSAQTQVRNRFAHLDVRPEGSLPDSEDEQNAELLREFDENHPSVKRKNSSLLPN